MTLSEYTNEELVKELAGRLHVWSRDILPCEHYKIVLRGDMIVEQSIGSERTTILVVR